MIRFLLKVGLILVVAVIGYNYFLGNEAEKENAHKIVNQVKKVGKSVKELVQSEREKVKEGKYDEVLNKLGKTLRKVKDKLSDGSDVLIDKLENIENKRKTLENELNDENVSHDREDEIKKSISKLLDETESLLNEVDVK